MCLRLKRPVTPFEKWKTILMDDVQSLAQHTTQDEQGQIRSILKQQTLGQHCCEAEEYLTDAELTFLKEKLGLTDQQWWVYKANVRPPPF